MTDGLVQFLNDRLNEDEQTARAMPTAPWRWAKTESGGCEWEQLVGADDGEILSSGDEESYRSWIRKNAGLDSYLVVAGPGRVLAEIDAKRRVLALHGGVILHGGPGAKYYDTTTVCKSCEPPQFAENAWPCPTLRLLALPYRDHPDYQPAWAPNNA